MFPAVALSLAAIAAAAPLLSVSSDSSLHVSTAATGSSSGGISGLTQKTTYTTTFEGLSSGNLLTGAVSGTVNLHQLNGLDFQGFTVANLGVGTTLLAGVVPPSPNVAVYGGSIQTLDGVLAGSVELPVITTEIAGSAINVFDLKSLYIGCTAKGDLATNVAAGCKITVEAFRNSALVAQQTLNFNPGTGKLRVNMVKANLNSDFTGLDTVKFSTKANARLAAGVTVATLIDNVNYTVYPAVNAAVAATAKVN